MPSAWDILRLKLFPVAARARRNAHVRRRNPARFGRVGRFGQPRCGTDSAPRRLRSFLPAHRNRFAVIQTSSDNASEDAAADFMQFVKTVASRYAYHIVMRFCAAVRN